MEFTIEFSPEAERHLEQFSARERKIIVTAIETQLSGQADIPTRNRKVLRENPLARWEMRVREFRVFYNIEELTVSIAAIGTKDGNKVIIEGEEHTL
jgi:mRNA-degrading endonuclease RelE of RelBE toxin-antitoxin system